MQPSAASDSLCFAHVNVEIPSCPRKVGSPGNPEGSRPISQVLEDIDSQAKLLLQTQAPLSNLKSFLKEIPWHLVQQQHSSSSRPLEEGDMHNPVKPSAYVIVGAFTYGGVVGVTRTTRKLPWTTRVMTKVLRLTSPGTRITSICVSCNVQSPPHRDRWNILKSQNVVVSLEHPSTGGELWIESRNPLSRKPQKSLRCGNQTVVGDIHQLRQPVVFEPRQWRHTLPWVGNRMVLVGYSTFGFPRMSSEDVTFLRKHGFPLPFRNTTPRLSTYGGVAGVTRTTRKLPWTTRVMTKVLRLTSPGTRITSICVSCNVQSPPHRDRWNILKSQNVVVSLEHPSTGGELWIESRNPLSRKPQKSLRCGNQTVVGDIHQLRQPVVFEPRQWHHTLPWVGNRMVLVGYSTFGFPRMSSEDVTFLRKHGFPLPFRNTTPRLSTEHQALISQDSEVPFGLSLRHEQQHGPGQPHEVRASAQAVGVWRAGPVKLDEDSVEDALGRVVGRAEGDSTHEREGCCQDGKQVQDQGGPAKSHGQLPGGLHEPHELRPAEEQDGAIPDGESGTSQQSRLHGLRQVRFVDIRGNSGVQPELHQMVSGDSSGDLRVPLEVEALRSLEPRDWSNGEEPDRGLVPQSGIHRSQDDDPGLQQPPGSLKLDGDRGVMEHSNNEKIPDETASRTSESSRIRDLEEQVRQLQEAMKSQSTPVPSEDKIRKTAGPPGK